jgi:DNA-directed RNA polymerase specialized sigma24 family protein
MSKVPNRTTDLTDTDLKALPDPQCSLLSALVNEQCSYKHLADTYSLPIGTVKSRIRRARQKIARLREKHAA